MPRLISKKIRQERSKRLFVVLPFLAGIPLSNATLNLPHQPLSLSTASIPNVIFMLDDSGSMDYELLTVRHYDYCAYWGNCPLAQAHIPERTGGLFHQASGGVAYFYSSSANVRSSSDFVLSTSIGITDYNAFFGNGNGAGDWRVFSSDFNRTYYDPAEIYTPWTDSLPNATLSEVRMHPIDSEVGYSETRDLTNSFYVTASDTAGFIDSIPSDTGYERVGNGMIDAWDDYTLHQIQNGAVARWSVTYSRENSGEAERKITDLPAITDPTEVSAIQQNYANWFQYYRRRSFVVNAAVSTHIKEKPDYRYSLGMINQGSLLKEAPLDNNALAAHNSSLLDTLFSKDPQNLQTPLRSGLEFVGDYLMSTGNNAPITESCQLNYAILITDGIWGGQSPNNQIGDEDGDGYSQTLADVGYYYYKNDLRPDLPDKVSTSTGITRQHMTTFTVAFGVTGDLTDSDGDGWPEINGSAPARNSNWGNPASNDAAKIDDLWHTAFNTNGRYTQANRIGELSLGLNQALATISTNKNSLTAVAVNAGRIPAASNFYQANFSSVDWTGDLEAFLLNADGSVNNQPLWMASSFLDGNSFNHNTRVVITADSVGKAFRYSGLSSTYQGLLTAGMSSLQATGNPETFGGELVNYLRGKSASTIAVYQFRQRDSILGDIISSSPTYVGVPNRRGAPYNTPSYESFRSSLASRSPTIYVGANDGMLHGFDADTGEEVMAFIPYSVANNLYHLADPNYNHLFYVDGPITVADACLGSAGNCSWSSVLTAGLGNGGRGLYTLDVTRPDDFSEANASNIFLWESGTGGGGEDDDVGHIFGKPSVVKLNNGEWGVITNNGYNSPNGVAKLLIHDAKDGRRIATLETNSTTDNGLSTPTVVDVDRDGTADAVYAGDLMGNLWKFDISATTASDWSSAYSSGGALLLYKGGSEKPITTAPQVGRHPVLDGYMVYFGTGKYLEANDNLATGQNTQAYHGVWDQLTAIGLPITDSDLLQQTIDHELVLYPADTNGDGSRDSSDESQQFRLTSSNDICWTTDCGTMHKGWQLDLAFSGSNRGERVIADGILRNDRIIFTTMQPAQEACSYGGQSWFMELAASSGASLMEAVIDINNDGVFDSKDRDLTNWTTANLSAVCAGGQCPAPSGVFVQGIVSLPTIIGGDGVEYKLMSKSDGGIERIVENPGTGTLGRQTWRELIDE